MTQRTSSIHHASVTQLQGVPSRLQQPCVTYALLAIFGLALGLRLWGIGFGLPYDFTPDEVHEILRAFKLGAGEYYWGYIGKGGLYYFLFVEYGVLYGVWRLLGRVANTHEFALLYFQDPSAFYLAGRLTVALMGAVTCLVIFGIGRRIYDVRVGLGAALIGATAYVHGMWSHYINVDVGMTLALWTSILAYLEYERNHQLRWLIGAGVLGGIATAFKLPGAIVLLFLCVAIGTPAEKWQAPRQMLKEAGIVLVAMLGAVVLVAPEIIMSIGSLHRHFSHMLGVVGVAHAAETGDLYESIGAVTDRLHAWTRYIQMLLWERNFALTISALLGLGVGLFRRHRWDRIWGLGIAVFLGIMSAAERGGTPYYLLPIMPGLWLLRQSSACRDVRTSPVGNGPGSRQRYRPAPQCPCIPGLYVDKT